MSAAYMEAKVRTLCGVRVERLCAALCSVHNRVVQLQVWAVGKRKGESGERKAFGDTDSARFAEGSGGGDYLRCGTLHRTAQRRDVETGLETRYR